MSVNPWVEGARIRLRLNPYYNGKYSMRGKNILN